MAEFKKRGGYPTKRPGGFRSGPARPSFRKDTGEAPEKFPATCSTCGAQTMVPFRPNGVKPVYCRDCFRGDQDVLAHRAPRPTYAPAADASTKQLEMINMKLDTLIRMLKDSAR